ncbi:MAG: CoA-binding protein [Candidatus Aenigmarchaeota archaeon]|nr:CoA-binding protein [Candidatus Aenigmarchaeota archaeon]
MVDNFFRPKSVAIIGASADPKKLGNNILVNFKKNFKGKIYPVNLNEYVIEGLKAYKNVKEIKDNVDLAVVVVPASIANRVVDDCSACGIRSVIIITAGYRESGSDGIILENRLKNIIKTNGVRVIGPNCIGVLDTYSGVDTIFSPYDRMERPKKGNISVISQSGSFGTAFLDWCAQHKIGINKFVSFGNRVDVDECDLVDSFAKDKDTDLIIIYLEGPKNGRELMKSLKNTTKTKPVIILKAGKSDKGAKAAASHTGTLAGSYKIFSSAMRQVGATEARTLDELFDFTKVLSKQRLAKGNRVAIVTNGGGYGVLSADACIHEGLKLAEFSHSSVEKIKKVMPGFAGVHNPLDLIGDATEERFERALATLIKDKNVDIIVVFIWALGTTLDSGVVDVISRISETTKKPIICGGVGSRYTTDMLLRLESSGIPTFPTPWRAMKAAKVLAEYGKVKKN